LILIYLGSAQLTVRDNLTGSLEVGKQADLIVLSDDLFKINTNKIHKTKILATYISGKMVYDGGLGVMVTELF
jgi:predicted amidohydrolase YtcJ